MSLSNAQAFNLRVEQSLELQAQLEQIRSPIDLMNLARSIGVELTGADVGEIAQTANHDWVVTLDRPMRSFFELAQQSAELNRELKQCQTPADALDLATRYGFHLTSIGFQQAATAAATIVGFSFEKLWFKNLGLL
jgi:Nif11 domain